MSLIDDFEQQDVQQTTPNMTQTWDKYPAIKNPDGSVSTELSITVTDPRINGGKPTNIPSIWRGTKLPQGRAIQEAVNSGISWRPYESIDEAISDAESRHGNLFSNLSDPKQSTGLVDEFEQQDQQAAPSVTGDLVSPQERQKRMLRAQSPLPAQDIRPMEAFAHGTMMPFGHVPPGDVYQQHPHMADAGAVTSMLGQSLPVGGPLAATTRLGKAGLGALGGLGFGAIPEYLKGMLQGKTQTQALKDASAPGAFGAVLGSVAPEALSVASKIATKFKTLASNTPVVEHLFNKYFDVMQSKTNSLTVQANKEWQAISKGLVKDSQERVYNVLEKLDILNTGASVKEVEQEIAKSNLTEAEQQAAKKYLDLYRPIQDFIKQENLADVQKINHVHHMYEGGTQDLNDYLKSMPGSKTRVQSTIQDAINWYKQSVSEVTAKGYDPKIVKNMTVQELKNAGFDPRMPRWLRVPLTDPGLSLASTMKSAYQTFNVRNFLHTVSDLKDEAGNFILEREGPDTARNYKTIEDPNNLLKKYFFAGKGGPEGRVTYLREGNVAVLKKYAPMVQKLISSNKTSEIQAALKESNRVLRSAVFYNVLFHGVNEASEWVQASHLYLNRLGAKAEWSIPEHEVSDRMIASGYQSNEVFKAKNAMYEAIRGVSNQNKIPVLSDVANAQNKFSDKTLWHFTEGVGRSIWLNARLGYLKQGFPMDRAERMASEYANDAVGMVAKNRLPELLKDPVFGKWVAFIPQWITTKTRKQLGAIAPGMVYKSFSKEEQKALQKDALLNNAMGLSAWMTSAALLNKALSGHWTWENAPGHRNPAYIETRFGYTIPNPAFAGLTLTYRLAHSLEQMSPRFGHPFIRAAYSQITGKDVMTGKPFVGPGMTTSENLQERGKQVVKDVNPYGLGGMVRESQQVQPNYLKQGISTVLPVYLSKDNPAGPVVTKLFNMRKADNPFHDIQFTPPWEKDLDRALLKNDYTTAVGIAKDHGKSMDYLRKQQMKFKYPISYALQYSFKGPERDKYLNMLSNEERAKLFDAMKKEQEKIAEQPE